MSGGSYDYLCFASDAESLARKREDLERMADRLSALPWAQSAAIETQRLLDALSRIDTRMRAAGDLLDVWRAIEWWDSGDTGEDTAREIVRQYEDAFV